MNNRYACLRMLLTVVLASTTLVAPVQADEASDAKRRLVEQKMRLVEMLVNSPAAKTREGEAAAMIARGQQSLADAKQALTEERLDAAATLLDEALRSASAASKTMNSRATLSESAQRKSLDNLSQQIVSYRTSLLDLTKDEKAGPAAKALLDKIDAARTAADSQASSGRLGEANQTLASAYQLAVEEIARLRAGQEVILALKFDTPADEFAYEQRRFASNEVLIDQMLAQGKGEGGQAKLVERYVAEAHASKDSADQRASAGDYPEAISLMEKAGVSLNRALQMLGVPVY